MKKIILIITGLMLLGVSARAQYTLDSCQSMARANYPLIKQYEIIDQVAEYSMENASRAWLPQVSLSGQAVYYSDVVSFPEQLRGIYNTIGIELNPLRHDQYRISLDINQTIWDGGQTKARKEAVRAEQEVSTKSNDAELYALESRIIQIYFGILTLEEQFKQAVLRADLIKENRKVVEAFVANEVAMASDLNQIDAELLTNEQQQTRIRSARKAYLRVLSLMTGCQIPEEATFEVPEIASYGMGDVNRPELALFDAQLHALEAQKFAVNSTVMPRFSFFAQGLYGNPGLNMFEDMLEYKWSLNYVVGVRFQWNISAFYTKKNSARNIDLSRDRVNVQKERFLYENELQQSQTDAVIEQMREIMKNDDEIIALRTAVREASESKYQNGTIMISDLLKDITTESFAKMEKSLHELEWLKKIYEMKNITNN